MSTIFSVLTPFLPKNSRAFPGLQNVFPGRCRSTAIFKCKNKRRLLTQNIYRGTTIHESQGQRPKWAGFWGRGWLTPSLPPAEGLGVCCKLPQGHGVWGAAPEAKRFCSILTTTFGEVHRTFQRRKILGKKSRTFHDFSGCVGTLNINLLHLHTHLLLAKVCTLLSVLCYANAFTVTCSSPVNCVFVGTRKSL